MEISMPYGDSSMTLNIPDGDVLTVVRPNQSSQSRPDSTQVVTKALNNPTGSPRLRDMARKGERICLLLADITRSWQRQDITVPLVLEELAAAGIRDEDITLLFATGTHRAMTPAEHEQLLGADIVGRFKIVDHQCTEKDNMRLVGTTRRGTPVLLNRHAVEADKIVSICGAAYHFLAGFSGGPKMVLPGIAGCQAIQHNHKFALNEGFGSGTNPGVRAGNIGPDNPFYLDMLEAAEMLPPAFSLNVVAGEGGNLAGAFAGDWKEAHLAACSMVVEIEGVPIPGRAPLLIASAGGLPKDINLYQSIKLVSNALEAAEPGSTWILIGKCPQGIGNDDVTTMLTAYENMADREQALREHFSIGLYSGFFMARAAHEHKIIFVTDIPAAAFGNTGTHVARTLPEAMELAAALNGGNLPKPCIIMPHGTSTLPLTPERRGENT